MTIADNDIIAEMRRQPEQGFRLLMRKYREPVYWHIRRMVVTHADAQDAAQETFVRIFKSMDSYRGNTSFAAWIYRIATNEALRLISKRHDNVSMEREGTNILDQLPADNYINIADTEAVNMQRAILALPPKQQVVFNMRFYDEMEYGDIAAATDSSVAAVKMNYHLAKEKVKKAIIN
jgi:RNA polymerase sigma-70 factor (ECF subfamily)